MIMAAKGARQREYQKKTWWDCVKVVRFIWKKAIRMVDVCVSLNSCAF